MTAEEILAALRQQYAQVQMGYANLDQNGNDLGVRYLRQPDGSTLTLNRNAQTGLWNGLLGSPFDGGGPSGDAYGAYQGSFDDSGRLTDAYWRPVQRSDGWFGENLGTIGPALVLGAAALGGGLLGGTGQAALPAGNMSGAGFVNLPGGATSMIPGSGAAALGGAAAAAGGASSGLGSLLTPGNVSAAASLIGGATAGGGSIPMPDDDSAEREAAYQANVKRINDLFSGRGDLYQSIYDDNYGLQSNRLNENREDTLRQLRFGAARSGLTGGSADVDNKGREQRAFGRALMDASDSAQGAVDTARANDERTRLNLISQMRTGLSADDATQSAMASMQDNVTSARNDQRYSAVDSYAAALAPTLQQYQQRQGRQQARQNYSSPYRQAGGYSGTLSR